MSYSPNARTRVRMFRGGCAPVRRGCCETGRKTSTLRVRQSGNAEVTPAIMNDSPRPPFAASGRRSVRRESEAACDSPPTSFLGIARAVVLIQCVVFVRSVVVSGVSAVFKDSLLRWISKPLPATRARFGYREDVRQESLTRGSRYHRSPSNTLLRHVVARR